MGSRDDRRQALAERLADHVLAHGLAAANLRALGAAAGTSDRMLLYYFADKDELIAAVLGIVALRLAGVLAAELPGDGRVATHVLLARIRPALRSAALRPYMALWLEMAARSARGDAAVRQVAGAIGDGFKMWLEERLEEPDAAATLLATIEGIALLDAIGRTVIGDAVTIGHGGRRAK